VASAPHLLNALKERNVRLTRQRRVVLDALAVSGNHVRAEDLLREGRKRDPNLDRATVYRTLAMLKEHGLIDELDLLHLDGRGHYYEMRGHQDHVHIGCTECGRVTELHSPIVQALLDEVASHTGFRATSARIEVQARCPECAGGNAREQR